MTPFRQEVHEFVRASETRLFTCLHSRYVGLSGDGSYDVLGGCLLKKCTISCEASGPLGSVNEP